MSSSQLTRKPNPMAPAPVLLPVAPAPVLAALVLSLSACCLEVRGTGTDSHTPTGGSTGSSNSTSSAGTGSTGGNSSGASSGSTTGALDAGPAMLWIGGVGAVDPAELPGYGIVPFDERCPCPVATLSLGGASVIDGRGDLWAQDPTGTVYVWTPDQLAASCTSTTPALLLSLPVFAAMAFDSDGNLWGSIPYGGIVDGYRAADLKVSGAPIPAWTLTGNCSSLDSLCGPLGLAFDTDGSLWVAASIGLQAFSPSTRTGPNDGGPDGTGPLADFHITTSCHLRNLDGGEPCVDQFQNLAFDGAGNLWISADLRYPRDHHLVAYSAAQVRNSKNDAVPTPVRDLVFSTTEMQFEIGALAFDAAGNLWAGASSQNWEAGQANLFRLPRESLALDAGATLATPDVSVALGADANISLAFSPIPPGLPIQP